MKKKKTLESRVTDLESAVKAPTPVATSAKALAGEEFAEFVATDWDGTKRVYIEGKHGWVNNGQSWEESHNWISPQEKRLSNPAKSAVIREFLASDAGKEWAAKAVTPLAADKVCACGNIIRKAGQVVEPHHVCCDCNDTLCEKCCDARKADRWPGVRVFLQHANGCDRVWVYGRGAPEYWEDGSFANFHDHPITEQHPEQEMHKQLSVMWLDSHPLPKQPSGVSKAVDAAAGAKLCVPPASPTASISHTNPAPSPAQAQSDSQGAGNASTGVPAASSPPAEDKLYGWRFRRSKMGHMFAYHGEGLDLKIWMHDDKIWVPHTVPENTMDRPCSDSEALAFCQQHKFTPDRRVGWTVALAEEGDRFEWNRVHDGSEQSDWVEVEIKKDGPYFVSRGISWSHVKAWPLNRIRNIRLRETASPTPASPSTPNAFYWLDNDEFLIVEARNIRKMGDDTVADISLDLRGVPGSKYVGKTDWFDAEFVKHHNGIVPECARRGKEPGEWMLVTDVPVIKEFRSTPSTPASALAEMEARKDAAYLERNQVVAGLAAMARLNGWRVGTAKTNIPGWSEDWHGCVYIDLPTGQVSWHYHDSQSSLFAGLPKYDGTYDGHTTEQKYHRVWELRLLENKPIPSTPADLEEVAKDCLSISKDKGPTERDPIWWANNASTIRRHIEAMKAKDAEIAELKTRIENIKYTLVCNFCDWDGGRVSKDRVQPALSEHIKVCPSHPMRALEAEIDRLRALTTTQTEEIRELVRVLDSIKDPMGDYYKGLRCGVEDHDIRDRYEAAEYGWQEAFEYVGSIVGPALAKHAKKPN